MTPDAHTATLLEWYERYIGEPDAETDVYLGFGLFFVGIALAIVGLALFLWSSRLEAGSAFYWNLRQIAIVLASLGLPSGMVGIVVLLPVDRRALYAAGGGLAVCGVSMAFFIAVYPNNWNVQSAADYSAQGIALYAIGLVVVLASTGAALVAYQLERSRPAPAQSGGDPREEITDERVARDIERAMEDVTLTRTPTSPSRSAGSSRRTNRSTASHAARSSPLVRTNARPTPTGRPRPPTAASDPRRIAVPLTANRNPPRSNPVGAGGRRLRSPRLERGDRRRRSATVAVRFLTTISVSRRARSSVRRSRRCSPPD